MTLTPIIPSLIILFVLLLGLGYLTLRPRMLRWGTTPDEASRVMGGDELIPHAVLATTRAISIDTGPEKVWPWLAQMGQGRGGFYSYAWLENLAGLDIHNADQIIPELQHLEPGDLIPFWRGAGVNVVVADPPILLVLAGTLNPPTDSAGAESVGGTWVFQLERTGTEQARLIVRSRVAAFRPAWLCTILMLFLEPMHFIMERRMLRGIQERAEN